MFFFGRGGGGVEVVETELESGPVGLELESVKPRLQVEPGWETEESELKQP